MQPLDYCSQTVLNFIEIHPIHQDVSHLQKYFLIPSAFLRTTPRCPSTSHQTWDFCDTFKRIHPHWMISGHLAAEEETNASSASPDTPWEPPIPPSCQVCAHTCTRTCTPREARDQEAELLHPTTASRWWRHTLFSRYARVVVSLNINLQVRRFPFIAFHTFCLSKMTTVTLKYYQQGN